MKADLLIKNGMVWNNGVFEPLDVAAAGEKIAFFSPAGAGVAPRGAIREAKSGQIFQPPSPSSQRMGQASRSIR